MDFKSIPEILAQFSKPQKILALLLLLLTVIIITIAPSFISAITTDRAELVTKINHLEERIKLVESENDTLQDKIRKDQMTCTDRMFTREQEFVTMMDELRNQLVSYKKQNNVVVERRMVAKIEINEEGEDGKVLAAAPPPPPVQIPQRGLQDDRILTDLIKKVDKMKSKINTTKNPAH